MNLEPIIYYTAFLEDGKKLAEYTSRDKPPEVGQIITIPAAGVSGSFEVLGVSRKSMSLIEIVVLKVRPTSN
jgi:hypothetical protein